MPNATNSTSVSFSRVRGVVRRGVLLLIEPMQDDRRKVRAGCARLLARRDAVAAVVVAAARNERPHLLDVRHVLQHVEAAHHAIGRFEVRALRSVLAEAAVLALTGLQ